MYVVEMTEDKLSGLSEHIEKALMHMGKVMRCVSEMQEEESSSVNERSTAGRRGGYPYRDYDEYGVGYRGSGRYSRY